MKFIGAILMAAAVLANTKALADALECYECEGSECSDNAKSIVCSTDTVATPTPTTPATTVASSTSSSSSSASSSSSPTTTSAPSPTTTTAISGEITTDSETTNPNTAPTTTTPDETTTVTAETAPTKVTVPTVPPPLPGLKSSQIFSNNTLSRTRLRRDANPSYACYTLYYKDDNKNVVKKGCVENVDKACDVAAQSAKGPLESCSLCRDNKCNNSSAAKLSISLTLLMLIIVLMK